MRQDYSARAVAAPYHRYSAAYPVCSEQAVFYAEGSREEISDDKGGYLVFRTIRHFRC